MQNKTVWMIAASAALLLAGLPANAAELKIFVGGAMTETVEKIGANFAKQSGNKLDYVSDTTGALQKRLAAGEKADVVVVTAAGLDAMQKENRIVPASRVELVRALIGVAVRPGASSPIFPRPMVSKPRCWRRARCPMSIRRPAARRVPISKA